jgi:hypothetical protein
LDREQIFRINGGNERVSFFEYAGLVDSDKEGVGVRICKWIPSSVQDLSIAANGEGLSQAHTPSKSFLQGARLTSQEIAGLAELSLALRRV